MFPLLFDKAMIPTNYDGQVAGDVTDVCVLVGIFALAFDVVMT